MIDFRSGRHALGVCAAIAMLAGCGGSQALTTPGASLAHVKQATNYGTCPALSGGTGILPDGDFSQAKDSADFKKGQVFAPDWIVSKRTIDLYFPIVFDLDGLCAIDLDGWQAGAIKSNAFSTEHGATYTITFEFSGNGGSPPTVKTMRIGIDHQFTQYTWDTSGGYDIQNGNYTSETWQFKATGRFAVLTFTSQDPKNSASGPVVGGITITKD
jgi:hypothetical protein